MKRKYSRITHLFLGMAAIFAGIGIIMDSIGIFDFHPGMLFPFLILYGGVRLLNRGRRFLGTIFAIIGSLLFLEIWLHIDAGDLIGFAFSFAIIYWGYRLIRTKKEEIELPPAASVIEPKQPPADPKPEQEQKETPRSGPHPFGYSMDTPHLKQSLIGNMFLTGSRWELKDMNIWHGIGEVKIDLSRALIHDGETVIMISGWIGDIDLFIPYDLDVSFIANVNMGDIDVFGNKQGGLNRSVSLTTSGYQQAQKRVRIIVTLLIGDIDIIYV